MSDLEPGYYDALSARGRCEGGEFVLFGFRLKPLSFRHTLQLEAWENALWAKCDRQPDMADLFHAAQICSRADFMAPGEIRMRPTPREMATFDLDEALATWVAYFRTCYGSRPELWKLGEGSGSGSPYRAPMEEFIFTSILRNSHGYDREYLETAPVALVMWIFEAMCEQIAGRSRILTASEKEEMARENSPAATRARKRREKIAGEIFKVAGRNPKRRLELLVALDSGTLPKNWKEEFRKKRPTSNVQRSTSKGRKRRKGRKR